MKEMKRLLALVLCFAMLIGLMPMIALRADAAEGAFVDAAIFCSDVHDSTSAVTNVFAQIKNSGVNFSTATFCGDTFTDKAGSSASVTSTAQSALGNENLQGFYAWGDHDSKSDIADDTGLVYGSGEGENYYIYVLSMADMDNDYSAEEAAAEMDEFTAAVALMDHTKPLFIASHQPLHARRSDNIRAEQWTQVINAAGEMMDIVFFWGHNHTGDNATDQAAYYVAKGGTLNVETTQSSGASGSGTSSSSTGVDMTINFTYMNAGYIGKSAGRGGLATTVEIYEDVLVFQDYNASGAYESSHAHNVEVARAFASTDSGSTEETTAPTEETTAPTEETTAPTEETTAPSEEPKTIDNVVLNDGTSGTYVVGDPGILFSLVVNYTDGSTEIVTQDVCVIESVEDALTGAAVDYTTAMQTPGEYAATVSYQGVPCGTKVYFTVSESGDSNYDLLNLVINGAEVTADVKNVTADETVVAAMGTVAGIDEFVAYDITATLAEGETATVSIPVPAEWAQGELHVYYITAEGTVSDETFEVTYADGYVTFTVTHFSTYAVTNTAVVPEDGTATVPGNSTTTTQDKFVYVLTDTIAAGDQVLIVSANSSSGYILGSDTDADNTVSILSGELVVGGAASNYTYIEDYGSGLVWTVGEGYTFTSGNYKLGVIAESGWFGSTSYSLTTSASESNASYNWTYSDYTLKDSTNSRYAYYYRRYSSDSYSSWTQSGDSQNIYIYKKVTSTVTTTTGTQTATYGLNITVNGTPASTMTAENVVNGDTLALGAEFTSTVDGQQPSGGTWTVTSSNTDVATVDNAGLVTFTGKAGSTTIRASYTWTENGQEYTIYNTLVITTTAMSYTMEFAEESTTVKIGAEQTLALETKNSEGNAVTAENVTWTSSNEAVATVADGVVTGVAAGDTTITAEWTDPAGVKHTDTVTVEVVDAVYALEIDQGDSVVHKGVQNGQTLALTATLTRDEAAVENPALTWSVVSGGNIATIDPSTGTLTFTGEEGDMQVRVTYQVNETMTLEDYITVHVNKSTAITPEESTTDFPRWPNEGAVRYDKTAQAVGNFSNTGVAMMELSLAGIPQKTGGAVDVVIMLDLTGSMSSTALTAAEESAIAFAAQIVKNTDGTFNDNRICIMGFNSSSSSPFTYWEMGTVTAEQWDSLCTSVRAASDDQKSGGTPYSTALQKCQSVLEEAKTTNLPAGVTSADDYKRSQFCVFVSDGGPTSYTYITNYDAVKAGTASAYTTSSASASGGSNQSDSNFATIATYTHEYYSTLMKDDGVTMYSVLTGLVAANYPNCTTIMKNIASDASKAYVVEDGSDTTALTGAFEAIAAEINQAATDITVTDKITEEYEMIFDWPDAVADANKVANQEFYIEVVNYELDATTHERNGNYDVLLRVYLTENADGTLAISKLVKIDDVTSSSAGTETQLTTTPVYTAVGEDEKGYFNLVDGAYVYVADGTGDYIMTEGATVSGTSDTVELHTPYFSYKASDKIIKWHVSETAENSEIALRYFLYLTGSLESVADKLEEGDEGYVAPGTYPTNDYATLEYVNFKDNECLQYFPEPQLTWNGAQVSYVFYLVNSNGVPVNTAGREVTFAEAVFVTKIYTEAVVWNQDEGKTSLDATKIADDLLPDDYTLYDSTTQYEIHVYQDESDNDLGNRFIITAGDGTTIVYNTKAGIKYSAAGTYTKDDVDNNFDFANTTVAFAVVWERKLVEDTVVIDFGLPVDINVTTNDFVYNSINAIGTNTPSAAINDGLYTESALSTKIDASTGMSNILALTGGHTVQIMNENVIRFTPGSMELNAPIKFNYETTTEYYDEGAVKTGYLYSTVTVIPATTVYYEDSFLTLESYTVTPNEDGTSTSTKDATSKWVQEAAINGVQDQDRPGEAQISAAIDADNNYGYDSAYKNMATHSMGSAAKIDVTSSVRGEATFTFWGTGFDVISTTSNATGTLIVQLYKGASATGTAEQSLVVDTYYGYTRNAAGEWEVSVNDPNALYQVPVMKMSGLTYGQYTVKIVAGYSGYFNHTATEGGYTLYLDAIRIYDPTGNQNDVANDAYVADGEGWPQYIELRNNIISAEGVTIDEKGNVIFPEDVSMGAVFIDSNDANTSIVDYVSYGPNNELYLAPGQSVAFALDQTYASIIADVQIAMKLGNGSSVSYEMYNAATDGAKSNTMTGTLTTATDLYYSIKDLASGNIVIQNTSGGILSITNIKVTYTQNPYGTSGSSEDDGVMTTSLYMDETVATAAVMSLRSMPVYEPEETEPTEPEVTEPETTVPEETEPEVTEPETTVPEVTEPETTVPEETEPEVTEPETTVPEETEPEVTEPETTEPEETKPSEQEQVKEIIKEVGKIIKKLFGWLFG